MYYGIYRNVRDCAWRCLIDFEIDSLPVDVLKIARMANIRVIKNSDVNDLCKGEKGKVYFDGRRWFIIYDDTQSTEEARFTIAHELGHIFLGHAMTYAQYSSIREFGKMPKTEKQANMFALRLLCPACILAELDAISADDIIKHCKVPREGAQKRSTRMQELLKRNKFFTSPIEKEVFENFKAYVKHEKELRNFLQDQL